MNMRTLSGIPVWGSSKEENRLISTAIHTFGHATFHLHDINPNPVISEGRRETAMCCHLGEIEYCDDRTAESIAE
jgi:hypothetical protein